MFRISLLTVLFISTCTLSSFSQIVIPQPSPAGSVSTTVGISEVKVDYFRPKMRGRAIFGEGEDFLVPFGEMWRTGANAGTVVTFEDDINIQDKNISAGKYLLLTVPGAEEWEFILYNDVRMGGNLGSFKEDEVAGKFTVTSSKTPSTVQALTFAITDLSEDSKNASIELKWENTSVKLPFTVNYEEKVMESIAKNTSVNPNNYAQAAMYYLNAGKDMEQAIEWMDLYLEQNPNAFWHVHNKAKMLAKAGKKKEAIATAKQSIETAKKSGNDFGYIKLNEDLIDSLK